MSPRQAARCRCARELRRRRPAARPRQPSCPGGRFGREGAAEGARGRSSAAGQGGGGTDLFHEDLDSPRSRPLRQKIDTPAVDVRPTAGYWDPGDGARSYALGSHNVESWVFVSDWLVWTDASCGVGGHATTGDM